MRHFSRAALCVAAVAGLLIAGVAEAAVGGPEAQATLTPSNAVAQVDLVDQSAEAEFVAVIVTDTATTKKTFAAGALLAVQGGQQRDAGGFFTTDVFARSLQTNIADASAPGHAYTNVFDVGLVQNANPGTLTTHIHLQQSDTFANATWTANGVETDAVGVTINGSATGVSGATTHNNFTDVSASHGVQRDAVYGNYFTAAGFGSPVIHAASEVAANALKLG